MCVFPARRLKFTIGCADPEQDLIISAALTLGLLEDDGWISPLTAKEFLAPVGPPCEQADIHVRNGK